MRLAPNPVWPPVGGPSRCGPRPLRGAQRAPASRRQTGFTLVELIVVMLLMAVLAGIGAARFADREPFAVQSAADQLVSSLRLAQATAIARRQTVHVLPGATPASLAVCLDAACTQPLPAPGGGTAWLLDAADLRLNGAAAFAFGPDGVPTLTGNLSLQVQGSQGGTASPVITVEARSGHVHTP